MIKKPFFSNILNRYFALAVLLPVVALTVYFNRDYEKVRLKSDAEGYNFYLPALLIYEGFKGIPVTPARYNFSDDGKIITKYPYGVALLELPFYAAAHIYTKGTGGIPDGYYHTYGISILIAGGFYLLLGMIILRKFLINYFSPSVASATCLIVCFGTNLLHYATRESGMSHVYSFFLFSLFLYLLVKFLKLPTYKNTIAIGLVFGVIAVTRPINLILGLCFFLFDVYDFKSLKQRVVFYFKNYPKILTLTFTIALVILPQLIYYKYTTGNYLYYSYGAEGFQYWNRPKILSVLFSYQNGLFAYTPIALVAFIGSLFLAKKRTLNGPLIVILFCLSTYIFASWWAWWFGGAFGHRCYIEYYAFLAISLGYIIQKAWSHRSRFLRWGFVVLTILFLFFNLRLTLMYFYYRRPWDGPDWTFDNYEYVILKSLLF